MTHFHGAIFAMGLLMSANAIAINAGNPVAARKYDLQRDSVEASVVRGGIVFRTYCVLCHGANGEGDGRAAARYVPPPANLVKSRLSDVQKGAIIRGGGQAVGRSPFMPPWGSELTNEQIQDLITYLHAISSTGKTSL